MCNLYSITTNQEAIRALFRVINRYVGNLSPMPGAEANVRAHYTCWLKSLPCRMIPKSSACANCL